MGSDDSVGRAVKDPLVAAVRWFKSRSQKEKTALGGIAGVLLLLVLWRTIEDHDTLFVLAETAHFVGIGLLGYKIYKKKSVAGKQFMITNHRGHSTLSFRSLQS